MKTEKNNLKVTSKNNNKSSSRKNLTKKIRFSKDELDQIKQRMRANKINNFSEYVRNLALYGKIIQVNFEELCVSNHQLAKIGNNINQIAKALNSTGNFYDRDFLALKAQFNELVEVKRLYDSYKFKQLRNYHANY